MGTLSCGRQQGMHLMGNRNLLCSRAVCHSGVLHLLGGWGDWVDEEEEPGEAIAKKKCMSRAVQLFLHCSHFCHCMAVR